MDKGKCRTCQADIIWVVMAKSGKKNPLNAVPDPEKGNVWQAPDDSWVTVSGSERDGLMTKGETLYLSHFATCAQSKQHRKPA